jgi:hypothetical protein
MSHHHSIQMQSFHFHNFYKAYYLPMKVYHKVLFIYCSIFGYLLISVLKNSLLEREVFYHFLLITVFLLLYRDQKMTMIVLDPNILNPYLLLNPSTISSVISLVITATSAFLSFIISWYFYRSYRFTHFGYLLGLPTGFAFLGLSFLFEYISLIFRINELLYPELFWIELILQSEALALIAISYRFKDYYYKSRAESKKEGGEEEEGLRPATSAIDRYSISSYTSYTKKKSLNPMMAFLSVTLILIPLMIATSDLVLRPYFDYSVLADLRFYMSIFNIIALAYIIKKSAVTLVKRANIRLLFIPAAFMLLALEQYSLLMTYFDNSSMAFIGSTIFRLAGLSLFVYVMYYATNTALRRKMRQVM